MLLSIPGQGKSPYNLALFFAFGIVSHFSVDKIECLCVNIQ